MFNLGGLCVLAYSFFHVWVHYVSLNTSFTKFLLNNQRENIFLAISISK